MKSIQWLGLHPLLSLILMTLLGGVIGFALTYIAPYILWLSWEQVVTTPPKVTHIFTMQGPMLYVRADKNALYECDLRLKSKSCHQVAQIPKLVPTRYTLDCPAIAPITPILVGNIVETHAQRECQPQGYTDVHVIVLEDGSVWMGRNYYRFNADGIAYLGMMGGAGSVVGLLFGMIILVQLWTAEFRNRRRHSAYSTSISA
jgi:hypothetical protein